MMHLLKLKFYACLFFLQIILKFSLLGINLVNIILQSNYEEKASFLKQQINVGVFFVLLIASTFA
jgi:hypothetical protein